MSQTDHSDFDVRYVMQLARLDLNDEEIAHFQNQLADVLEMVDKLKQVDVTGVEEMAHANPVFNVFREDKVKQSFSVETALSNAPRHGNSLIVMDSKVVD